MPRWRARPRRAPPPRLTRLRSAPDRPGRPRRRPRSRRAPPRRSAAARRRGRCRSPRPSRARVFRKGPSLPDSAGIGWPGRMATTITPAMPRVRSTLRRQLHLLGAVAVSIGVMAPTLAMSVTGVEPARLLGRAAPLAFVFAAIGVGLVAYGFTRLAGAFASAGSVYAFAGQVLGPRAGFVTGWTLLGTYLVFPAVSISAVAIFGQAFLKSTNIAPH